MEKLWVNSKVNYTTHNTTSVKSNFMINDCVKKKSGKTRVKGEAGSVISRDSAGDVIYE